MDGIAVHTYSDKYISATLYDNMTKLYPTVGIYYTETSINTGWGKFDVDINYFTWSNQYTNTANKRNKSPL